MLVVGYVIKGRWKYLEHDWTAEEGSFVFEPPGEVHTLTVPADCAEMITFFNISGAMIYVDAEGRQTGYEDVFTKIDDVPRALSRRGPRRGLRRRLHPLKAPAELVARRGAHYNAAPEMAFLLCRLSCPHRQELPNRRKADDACP